MKMSSSSLVIYFALSSLLFSSFSASQITPAPTPAPTPTPGIIERTTKQHIVTTIHPGTPNHAPTPFLTSPSDKYTAFLVRTETALAAGGFGNDFCYIQIQDSETEQSLWESECTPVSTANACTLVFGDEGLAIFDGSTLEWDTGAESADDNPLERLELVDQGDMYIRDEVGELAWKASEDPRANQKCGERGSPGLGLAMPPFAQPIGGGQNLPFGQRSVGSANGASQTFGFAGNAQPLVDRTDFDSGSERGMGCWFWTGWTLLLCWLSYGSVL